MAAKGTKSTLTTFPEKKDFFTLTVDKLNQGYKTENASPDIEREFEDGGKVGVLMNEYDETSQRNIHTFLNSILFKIGENNRALSDDDAKSKSLHGTPYQGVVRLATDDQAKSNNSGNENLYSRVPKTKHLPTVEGGKFVDVVKDPAITTRNAFRVDLNTDTLEKYVKHVTKPLFDLVGQQRDFKGIEQLETKTNNIYEYIKSLEERIEVLESRYENAISGEYILRNLSAIEVQDGVVTTIATSDPKRK